jgi:hypothetical protein
MLGVHLQQSERLARGKEVEGDNQRDIAIRPVIAERGETVIGLAERLEMHKVQVQEEHSQIAIVRVNESE